MVPSVPGPIRIVAGIGIAARSTRGFMGAGRLDAGSVGALLAAVGVAAFLVGMGIWFTVSPEAGWRSKFDD